jgi:hypothetical protein
MTWAASFSNDNDAEILDTVKFERGGGTLGYT